MFRILAKKIYRDFLNVIINTIICYTIFTAIDVSLKAVGVWENSEENPIYYQLSIFRYTLLMSFFMYLFSTLMEIIDISTTKTNTKKGKGRDKHRRN